MRSQSLLTGVLILISIGCSIGSDQSKTREEGEGAKAPNLAGMSVAELEALIARAESAKADAEREAKQMELLALSKATRRKAPDGSTTQKEPSAIDRSKIRDGSTGGYIDPKIKAKFRDGLKALDSPYPTARAKGALSLGPKGFHQLDELEVTVAISKLIELLGDDTSLEWFGTQQRTTPGVEAARALFRIGGPGIEALFEATTATDQKVRISASYGIAVSIQDADSDTINRLTGLLGDDNSRVRANAVKGLRNIGNPVVEPLITALKDEEGIVRSEAAKALGDIGGEGAVDLLISHLQDDDKFTRREVAKALGVIASEKAVNPLLQTLEDDKDTYTRCEAAEALGMIGSPSAVRPLITILETERGRHIRSSAALGLGKLGDPKAFEILLGTLRDEAFTTRASAARALGDLGDVRAVGPLIDLLAPQGGKEIEGGEDSKTSFVRGATVRALNKLLGSPTGDSHYFGQDQETWRSWWRSHGGVPPSNPTDGELP